MNKLFVGNLSWSTSENDLRKHFEKCGTVVSVKIITDKVTDKSKGFGFVEMASKEEAEAAIRELNEKDLGDRTLRVSLAQERQERPSRPDRGGERREYRGGGNSDYSSRGSYNRR